MNVKQALNIRREALSHLCQVPPSDVMASESWAELRVSLMDALADNDDFISQTALSFHAKMFAGKVCNVILLQFKMFILCLN